MSLKMLTVKYTVVLITICSLYLFYSTSYESESSSEEEEVKYVEKPEAGRELLCNCVANGRSRNRPNASLHSTCADSADSRGSNQRVISYSIRDAADLQENRNNIELNAESVANYLPGWVIRIYHNSDIVQLNNSRLQCIIWCKYHWLDFCPVYDLPPPLYDQSNTSSAIWKFFVMGDPLVDRFLVSDVNSVVDVKVAKFIDRWLASNSTWTMMRYHQTEPALPFLLGVLGGVNHNETMTSNLRSRLINGDVLFLQNDLHAF